MSKALYYFALLPPVHIQEEVNAFKQEIAQKFDSTRALNSPPHITLIPPFWHASQQLDKLREKLHTYNSDLSPFVIKLKDFGAFPPRVIFINVQPNPFLSELQGSLKRHFENEGLNTVQKFGFHPHITIAFKDLSEVMYHQAKAFFDSVAYERTFEAETVTLLRLSGQKWSPVSA